MKVYIATDGEYSDYRVCHVFATEELAREYVERGPGDDYFEAEVKTELPPIRDVLYLNWSSAQIPRKWSGEERAWEHISREEVDADHYYAHDDSELVNHGRGYHVVVQVYGVDHERVRKAYSERVAKVKAALEGLA